MLAAHFHCFLASKSILPPFLESFSSQTLGFCWVITPILCSFSESSPVLWAQHDDSIILVFISSFLSGCQTTLWEAQVTNREKYFQIGYILDDSKWNVIWCNLGLELKHVNFVECFFYVLKNSCKQQRLLCQDSECKVLKMDGTHPCG